MQLPYGISKAAFYFLLFRFAFTLFFPENKVPICYNGFCMVIPKVRANEVRRDSDD
jgi:hypothetical protein